MSTKQLVKTWSLLEFMPRYYIYWIYSPNLIFSMSANFRLVDQWLTGDHP